MYCWAGAGQFGQAAGTSPGVRVGGGKEAATTRRTPEQSAEESGFHKAEAHYSLL